jgi:hypothetical protein
VSSYIHRFRAFLRKNETARGLFLVGIIILGAIAVWGGIRLALNTPYPVLVVSSYSMCQSYFNPSTNLCTLNKGDLIVIQGVSDPTTLQVPSPAYQTANCCGQSLAPVGSIIVFYPNLADPGFLVVHRVYSVVTNASTGQIEGFRTKGDGNSTPDSWTIPPSQIVGAFQFTIPIPYLGQAILDIRDFMYNSDTGQPKPQGILVIVALIVALFAFEVMEPGKKSSSSKSEAKSEQKPGDQGSSEVASMYEPTRNR